MKKIIFTLAVLLIALPAAADVEISMTDGDPCCGWVTISYDDGGGELVRGFALDIQLSGSDAVITDVNDDVNGDYTIYPGSIDIDPQGNIVEDGQAVAGSGDPGVCGGMDSNCITIEMGSLYVGAGNAPAKSGELLKLRVSDNCTVTISGNALRGNVVLEDVSEATIVSDPCDVTCFVNECYDDGGTVPGTYQNWVDVGKPGSWCCLYQHLGDGNGNGLTNIQDLMMIFKPAYNSAYGGAGAYDADADCNRNKLVNIQDLMMCFKPNYNATHQAGYLCEHDTW